MAFSSVLGPPPALQTLIDRGPVALFLDFDGTLVELASGPDGIEPRADLNERLSSLSSRLEGRCAVVSGRGLSDIEKHIGPLSVAGAGSHGSDMRLGDGTPLGEGAQSLPGEIERRLRSYADENSLDYEEKPHGGALHYRSNPDAGPEAHAFAQELAGQHGWAAQSGKCVVEIVEKSANKGAAVHAFMQEAPFAGARPFFIGDDLTDEAGFAACEQFGGAGIIVGERAETRAHFLLENVTAVHEWLDL
ncbi:trehalose-phosphatase [Erythrobacter sp. THAF29]|uniref:trehalose-phosphatase n=1 Tax=Erythrobacter sp. THAF29 TaxID=2587851 RepID=UPI001562A939|nr:trehalose-phosphatase [Erythrobacter sp. THAF29]